MCVGSREEDKCCKERHREIETEAANEVKQMDKHEQRVKEDSGRAVVENRGRSL